MVFAYISSSISYICVRKAFANVRHPASFHSASSSVLRRSRNTSVPSPRTERISILFPSISITCFTSARPTQWNACPGGRCSPYSPIQKSSEDPPGGFRSPYRGARAAHSLSRSGHCRPPFVYLEALVRSCSSTKTSHFSSVSTSPDRSPAENEICLCIQKAG